MLCKFYLVPWRFYPSNFSFGRSWPGLLIFIGFFTYLIQNSIAIFGDGGVMEKCHAVQAELAKSEKKKLEAQNDKNQSSNLLYQKRTEIEHTNNEISTITKDMIHFRAPFIFKLKWLFFS